MRNIFYLLLIVSSFTCTRHFNAANNIEEGIKVSSMEQEGINAAIITSLDSAITKGVYPNIHSLLIAKNNKLVFEKYWPAITKSRDTMAMMLNGKDSLHFIASITKSIVSACIGIAIKQGKIKNVHQRIFDFFPEYSMQDSGLKSALTIRHLLTMSSGIKWDEDISYNDPENSSSKMTASTNVVEYVLSQPMDFPPGKVWNYNSGGPQLLATIIEKSTGKQIDRFASEFLFKPLGIKYFKWSKYTGTGIPMASGGLRLRSRDLLKFGLLYSNKGKWKGIQIVPDLWADESFVSQIKAKRGREYGFLFYIFPDTINNKPLGIVAAVGNGDQRIYLDKSNGLIVVFTAGNYNNRNNVKNSYAILKDYIYPALINK